MGIYVQGDLSVETKITIESIEELALEVKLGEHGKLILKGSIKEEDGHSILFTSWENTEIKLYGKGELLFYGVIRQINLTHEGGLFTILLEAVSAGGNGLAVEQTNGKSVRGANLCRNNYQRAKNGGWLVGKKLL